jgi:NAD(P)-dependent dehydrogenase (short-subunit alcohol dehydrogenase family)
MPQGLLKGKTIIVTGAGGGLGESIARVCHREQANVIIADIRGDAAQRVARSLGGPKARAVQCDVSRDADLKHLVDFAVQEFKRIDGLVNNAGVNFAKPFLKTTRDEWQRVIDIDLSGVFLLTQRVCRQMIRQRRPAGGSIVNISSVHSHASVPGAGPYDAAKCGVVGLSKALAVELADKKIRVNVISPGLLNTQIWRDLIDAAPDRRKCLKYWMSNIPIGRVIEPAEIAELAAFLLSDRASCMTGANIMADGGVTAQLISKEQ